jgi:hypothetical protein
MAMAEIAITSLHVVTYFAGKRRSLGGHPPQLVLGDDDERPGERVPVSRQVTIARDRIAGQKRGATIRKWVRTSPAP